MVKFINISQYYGKFRALYNINFEIKKGCLLALLGPNGAGKSTIMSIMTGFRPPLEGEVYINGIDIFEFPEKAKSFIGYLAEIPPLYPELTVVEYLTFIGEMREIDNLKERIKEVLLLLKLTDREGALIKNLSKGLKQRVGIAQSVLHKPKLLVLDEPTVGLEPAQLIEFRQVIRHLAKEEGMTVVISTHIMVEASELCDEVIIIDEGKKIFEGTKNDLLIQNKESFSFYLVAVRPSEELLLHLQKMKKVITAEFFDHGIKISTEEDISELIVEETIKFGAGVKSISPIINSLEKVFLDLTIKK
ncbi:MAG: ABC transporter ATP-binding protein [Brevinema sp.]